MKYAFTNATILDGSADMTPQPNKVVLVEGENITAILDAAQVEESTLAGCEVVDLAGKYLMPGLVNLHVHLPAGGKPPKPGKKTDNNKLAKTMTSNAILKRIAQAMCEGYARTELMSGVTTLRTVGGIADLDTTIRDRIAQGKAVGPRILASNMAVSVPGGHMAGSVAYAATTMEEAVALVGKIAGEGVDLIKLMITGGVLDATVKGEPGELKMPPAYVKAACEEAHRLGLKVAAHVESPAGVIVALDNGVDSIEHGAEPTEEMMALFHSTGACHVATFSPAVPYALFDPAVSHVNEVEKYNGEVLFQGIINCAKTCLEQGIPVGLGTDTGCPFITHYDMWREVNYFHKFCGVSNAFALHTATAVNAGLLGLGDVTGTVEVGKCADLLITVGNPMEDLRALRYPHMVMARGQLVRDLKVKKDPAIEEELDKFM